MGRGQEVKMGSLIGTLIGGVILGYMVYEIIWCAAGLYEVLRNDSENTKSDLSCGGDSIDS